MRYGAPCFSRSKLGKRSRTRRLSAGTVRLHDLCTFTRLLRAPNGLSDRGGIGTRDGKLIYE
jgi:hypothetical protein